MFPIAVKVADDESLGLSPELMAYCLMLAASASFMTPFGYQTNLLVYGPGGYDVKDFLKFGIPMQLILWVFTTLILTNPTGMWWPSWVATGIVFIVVSLILVSPSTIRILRDRLKLGLGRKKSIGSRSYCLER